MNDSSRNGSALRVHDLSHWYGPLQALSGLHLEIARGEFVAVVGPSGCGKSTLLHLLSGHVEPSGGSIDRVGGVRTVYQHGGLFPWLTAEQNIHLGLRHVRSAEERAHRLRELLAAISMQDFAQSYPHQLSGGMRQRVEIARALAADAEILLMDEPFSSLDYFNRLHMREELVRVLRERPRTVVFVTHDVQEAAQLAGRVLVLSERPGRVCGEVRLETPRPRTVTDSEVVLATKRVLELMGLHGHLDR